jgi:DNA repair exonuclease SbcCD ATPase subunit
MNWNLYPYTNIHELNLDWILDEIKKFREELEQIEDYGDRITQLEVETDNLERDLTALSNNLESFKRSAESTHENLQRQIRDNNKAIVSLKSYVLDFEDRNKDEHKDFDRRINNLVQNYAIILQDLARIRVLIADGDERTLILAKDYADLLLEEFKREFPKLYDLYVFSPITGQIVTVQVALNELYEAYRFYAITAKEFDELGWTAEELDRKHLTALELDTNSRSLLQRFEREQYVIRNPWFGDFVDFKEVLYKLVGYHIPTLNCYQRDLRELTAQELDDREYNAYYLDWGLNWAFYQTCQQRDDAAYTAQALDDLEFSCYTWDSEGGWL